MCLSHFKLGFSWTTKYLHFSQRTSSRFDSLVVENHNSFRFQKCPNSWILSSVQFSRSVVSDSLWPLEPQHTGLPVHHQLPESTQTHVHWVGNAIQPFHPLLPPSPPALNLSQHQSLFKWVSSPHQVAKVLEFQLQYQSLQWTPRTNLL